MDSILGPLSVMDLEPAWYLLKAVATVGAYMVRPVPDRLFYSVPRRQLTVPCVLCGQALLRFVQSFTAPLAKEAVRTLQKANCDAVSGARRRHAPVATRQPLERLADGPREVCLAALGLPSLGRVRCVSRSESHPAAAARARARHARTHP